MSDYTTNASVNLYVNGKEAKQAIEEQRVLVDNLRKAYAKAKAEGDESARSLEKEYKKAQRELKSMQTTAVNVADVLRKLDTATPKELKSTLKSLNNDLANMERGSKAWNEQVKKIQSVKKELDGVKSSLSAQKTGWQKMGDFINKWQTMTVAAFAVVMKVVSVGRYAVNAYASIDQEMANTQKFTGMTREEVESLNEEFKKMDTRTGREELNKLAQSAGRLGKNSTEDVLGFVRAGDQISVAMDELGDEAPEVISKLSGIFNLEAEMGTEKAMLSTGSAINSLSQVCAASAPNLVDFSSRLGAVASSSNMAISEMLAFGAVLDSNGVSIEKGATAMQGVVTKMYAEPSKFAKIANLDVKEFTEALERSSTEGLMMFINRLSQMDQMQMSATLKELGTAGAGVTQTFQTLANKSEDLKLRMQQSNKAFSDASSVGEEYAIQNNTLQASLDKAKEKFRELQRTLGQKLAPVMQHVISSTGAIVRVLIEVISFVGKYKGELIVLTTAIVAYNVAANVAVIKTKAIATWQGIAKTAAAAWTVVTQAAAVATALLTGKLHEAKIAFKTFSALIKANPMGLLVGAITAVVAGLILLTRRTNDAAEAQKTLNKIRDDAQQKMADEKMQIELLVAAARNEKLSLEERQKAVDKLNCIIPNYNAQLDATTGKYIDNKKALDDYLTSLQKKYELEGAKDLLAEIGRETARLNAAKAETQKALDEAKSRAGSSSSGGGAPTPQTSGGAYAPRSYHAAIGNSAEIGALENRVDDIERDIAVQNQKRSAILGIYGDGLQKDAVNNGRLGNDGAKCPKCGKLPCVCYKGGNGLGNADTANDERFKAENEWREREDALNRIAYATGQKSHQDYTKRMIAIEVEYYQKLKDHKEANADEQLQFEAQYYEALQKQQTTNQEISFEQLNAENMEHLAILKRRYIDGDMSLQAYNEAVELSELNHLAQVVDIYKEGTAERLKAESDYTNAQLAYIQRRHKDTEAAERTHQDQLAQFKTDFFGDNLSEQTSKYNADLAMLQQVYDSELQAAGDNAAEKLRIEEAFEKAKLLLKQKYNLLGAEDDKNAMQRATDDVVEWLNSDGGKAVTQSFDAIVSGMSSIFSQVSSLVQAELEIETAAIEKRYDKEIAQAEGNTYKIAKLEKQKEKEIAEAKNKANKKMFAMQVIQAVAQTAQNAINAYGSAAAIPVTGFIMAPIAAAMAVAAGALQIAAIKKQQQASEAQGYAKGGFTGVGGKYEPAGIVHKGEWVASQELLASPVARPMINALDYAQRTNTIGSLRGEDVSRAITAPVIIASNSGNEAIANAVASQSMALANYAETMRRLNTRLDEPFVTVNTVAGDTGIKKAQDEYDKLMRNKTPKSKRK